MLGARSVCREHGIRRVPFGELMDVIAITLRKSVDIPRTGPSLNFQPLVLITCRRDSDNEVHLWLLDRSRYN